MKQLILLLSFAYTILSIPIDNGLTAEPRVICGNSKITIDFQTSQPFAGNIYTKGYYKKEECRVRGDQTQTSIGITVPVNFECGLRRKRVLSPNRGLMLETTVVIMFHPIFLTKIDKSYRVQCLYMEADKEVTQTLDVSTMPPDNLSGNEQSDSAQVNAMPTCQYEVLRGGPNGSPLKYATIGESVYHKWSCDGPQRDIYCMTVHSCTADDGLGFGQQLLNDKGCSLDKFLLNNLDYINDMQAGQEAHVFKFADRPTIFFGCQIRLELKEEMGGTCQRANCPEPLSVGDGHPIDTPNRVQKPIESDFPRPGPSTIPTSTFPFSSESSDIFTELSANQSPQQVFRDDPSKVRSTTPMGREQVTRARLENISARTTTPPRRLPQPQQQQLPSKLPNSQMSNDIDDSDAYEDDFERFRRMEPRPASFKIFNDVVTPPKFEGPEATTRDARNFDKLLYKPMKPRRTRNTENFHVDLDVVGQVDVLDLPPGESLQPLRKERDLVEEQQVCLSRSLVVFLCLAVISFVGVISLLFCLVSLRIRHSVNKKMLDCIEPARTEETALPRNTL